MRTATLLRCSTARRSTARRWDLAALALCIGLLAGCKSELFGKVDEADANAALDILYSEGIRATKSSAGDDLWRVEVDEKDHQRALQVTRSQGIPRERFVSMGDLFQKEGLVSTPSEIRMRYIFAVSQELSNTLSHIDGVISARVHPVIPVNDPLSDKVQPSSAAVFIKHLPDADLQQMAPAIKTLVTRSIEGLRVEHVSLTFFATRVPTPPPPQLAQLPAVHASLFPGEPVVSSLAVLLASFLALTWGAMGVRMWRRSLRSAQLASLPPAARRPVRHAANSSAPTTAGPDARPAAANDRSVAADTGPRFDAGAAEDVVFTVEDFVAYAHPVAVSTDPVTASAEPVTVFADPMAAPGKPVAVAAAPLAAPSKPVAASAHPAQPIVVSVEPAASPARRVAVPAEPFAAR